MSTGLTGQFNGRAQLSSRYDGDFNADSTRNVMNFDWSGGGATQHVSKTPVVTDIIKNKSFVLPNVKASSAPTVQSAGASAAKVDTGAARSQVGRAETAYKAADTEIKNTVREAMKQEVGAKNTDQALGQLLPSGGVSKIQAVGAMMDPTGIVGSIVAVMDAIYSEMKGFNNAKINEILEVTLSRLQQSSQAQAHGDMNGAQQIVPDGHDYSDLTVSALKEFLERDPGKDPIMREIQDISIALDDVDADNLYVINNDHREGAQGDKLVAAIDSGNVGDIKAFTTSQVEAGAVMAGADVDEVFVPSASEIEYQAATLADLSGVKTNGTAIVSLTSAWAKANVVAPEASQSIEYDTTKLLSMNSAA